jgi:tRNA (guanine-N7-)-methyltransferase
MPRMARQEIVIEAPELRLDTDALLEKVDWKAIFGKDAPVEIEVGIGKGRFLLAAAAGRPEVMHLGIEWTNKYLRFAESRAKKRELENIKFARLDVHHLMPVIPDHSVTAFYVFYPDPWPKKRHLKRRFLQLSNAVQMSRTLVAGGHLHVATDHDPYWSEIEPLFDGHPDYVRLDTFGGKEFPVPVDGPLTNYEEKYAVQGRSRHRGSWRTRD